MLLLVMQLIVCDCQKHYHMLPHILHVSLTLACFVQVYAMPVYDMIEYQLVKHRVPNGFVTRLAYRTIYIVLVAFVAITLPFFGGENSCLCVGQSTLSVHDMTCTAAVTAGAWCLHVSVCAIHASCAILLWVLQSHL